MVQRLTHRSLALRLWLALTVVLSTVVGSSPAAPNVAQAAIDNNQPSSPVASIVDGIRTAADRGLPSYQSPRFVASVQGSAWSIGRYEDSGDPQIGDSPADQRALVEFGDGQPDAPGELGQVTRATLGTTTPSRQGIGATYGLAYSSGMNPAAPVAERYERIFVGAMNKRITRFGPGGPGGIYLVDPSGGTTALYVQVPDVVPGPDGLPGDPGDGSAGGFPNGAAYTPGFGGLHTFEYDSITKFYVARTSLGDLELTPDERSLVALNLRNQRLYVYDTWSANPQSTQQSFPVSATTAACPGGAGNFRPYGLHYQGSDSSLLVGYVCSAETSQNRNDLRAGVLRLSTAGGWSRLLDFPLMSYDAQRVTGAADNRWQPWSDDYRTDQPILSDMEVTEDGSLILGFRDRGADIGGTALSGEFGVGNGDLLRALPNGAGGWAAPNAGAADYFTPDTGYNTDYQESLWGATAYIPGTNAGVYGGEVISTAGYAYRAESGGTGWFNLDGTRTAREELYGPGTTSLQKASGLGDVEILTAWRAIGNRVWRDSNANGVQDVGEPDIDGVELHLLDATSGSILARVTTGPISGSGDNWRFYVPPFQPYVVAIAGAEFAAGGTLQGMALASRDAGGNDATDSDADTTTARIAIDAGPRSNVNLSYDFGLSSGVNLRVDKSGPAIANPGQSFSYTIAVTNDGPSAATNVSVVDTLPAGFGVTSGSAGMACPGDGTCRWNLGTLAAGQTVNLTLTGTIAAGFNGTLTNRVDVTTSTPGDPPGDNSDTVVTTVNAPNLTLTKSCPATAFVGQNVTYTIGYQNTGTGTFVGVSIADILPAGMTYVSSTPLATFSGGQYFWLVGNMPTGASGTLTIVARAEASTVNTSVTNQVALQSSTPADTAPADNAASCVTQVQGADVSIVKSGPATVLPGASFSYTLVATNNGPAPAANVQVSDTFPGGVFLVSATPAPSTTPAQNPQVWNLGTLNPGQSVTIQVNAQVFSSVAGGSQLINTATITTSTPGDTPGDNSSLVTTTVITPNISVIKDGPTTVVAGDPLVYTLTVGNNGTAPAANVTVQDTFPGGVFLVSATPAPSTTPAQNPQVWNLGTLNPGQSVTIQVNAQVFSGVASGTLLTNQANVTTTTPGDAPADNSDTALTTVQRADVRITKSSPTSFPVDSGQSVTYFLDYTSAGPAAAQNVVVTDSVPAQISSVSWSCTSGCAGSGTGNSISVSVGSLAVGASGRITVMGTATTALARDDFTNTATIATSTPETDTSNNQSSVPGAVWTTDLQLIKDASPQVIAGTTFTATLAYRNNGPAPARLATIADTLPAGVTFISSVPAPASQAGQNLSWNIGTLADQASGTIALTLQADSALTPNLSLLNRANISTSSPDRNSSNNQDDATTTVIVQADLRLNKTGSARVDAGEIIGYSLGYTNDGPSVARSTVITDTLPPGVAFVSASPSPTTNSGGILTWQLGDLTPSAGGSISVVVISSSNQAQASLVLTNQARIGSSAPDPDPSDNQDDHQTTVETVDLQVSKTMPATAIAGQIFTATLTLRNAGPTLARSVVFTDTLPAGLSYVSATPAPSSVSGQVITWNAGDLAASPAISFQVVLRSATTTPNGTTYTNTDRAATTSADRDLTNNQASATTQINRQADLRITKTASSPGPLLSGAPITYTLSYGNNGPSAASSAVITDTLPTGFTLSSASPAPTTNSAGTLSWAVGDLAPNATGSITVRGMLTTSQASETLTNSATIGSPTSDPFGENNLSTVTIELQTVDVSVIKTATPNAVYAGEMITYTLLISNAGPAGATNVVLSDTLPSGVTFVSASPAPGTSVGGLLVWNIGPLANGQSRSYSVVVRVNPNMAPGLLTNSAVVQTAAPDRDRSNNQSQVITPVGLLVDLRVSKDDGRQEVEPGDTLTYTLSIENVGRTAARNVLLSERPPLGATVLSADWQAQGGGLWVYRLAQLDPGERRSLSFVLRLPNPLNVASIRNVVQVSDDGSAGPDPTPADNTAEDEDQLRRGALGDRVWFDADADGLQGAAEVGVEGLLVQLLDPTSLALIAEQLTGIDGAYDFAGLRLGSYAVQIAPTALQSGPYAGYRVSADPLPSTLLTPTQSSDMSLDIGLHNPGSTEVSLASLSAREAGAGSVDLRWRTVAERNSAGFRILRAASADIALAEQIGYRTSQGSQGGSYSFSDLGPPAGPRFYWLVAVELGGREQAYGPLSPLPALSAQQAYTVYLPMIGASQP